MLSSQLALHGLQAFEDGNPYVATFISQEKVIEKFNSFPRFKAIWDKAMNIAQNIVPENKDGVVHIQLVYVCFITNTIQIIGEDFDFSAVNSHAILHSKGHVNTPDEELNSLIKSEVNVLLFS